MNAAISWDPKPLGTADVFSINTIDWHHKITFNIRSKFHAQTILLSYNNMNTA